MNGLAGNMQAQPRVFAHDAQIVYTDKRLIWLDIESLSAGTGYTAGAKAVTGAISGANNATITITVNADGAITTAVITAEGSGYTEGERLTISGGTGGVITGHTTFIGSEERGACIYVGNSGDIEAIMESGSTVIFANAATGSFLPILVKQVLAANTTASNLLALF